MTALLIELPYVLIPLAVILISFRRRHFSEKKTFIITGVIIFLYPAIIFWIFRNFDSLTPSFDESPLFFIFFAINTLFFLPFTLLLQFIFNRFFLPKQDTMGKN
jgi:hypothetical protein